MQNAMQNVMQNAISERIQSEVRKADVETLGLNINEKGCCAM